MRRALTSVFGLLVLAENVAGAAPKGKSFDILTYTPPPGWNLDDRPGADHVAMSTADEATGRFFIISIYKGRAASGDLAADFRSEWTDIIDHQMQTEGPPAPTTATSSAGLQMAAGAALATWQDRQIAVELFVLDGGSRVVSVMAIASDVEAAGTYQNAVETFLAGVTVRRSAAPPPAPPAAEAPAPAPAAKQINLAALVGSWQNGAAFVTSYYSSSTGGYQSGQASFYQEFIEVKADGAFTYSFQGMSGRTVIREKDSGVVVFEPTLLVFKGKQTTRKYHFIDWQEAPDGSIMVLLSDSYQPGPGTGLYQEKWGRAKAKAKPSPK